MIQSNFQSIAGTGMGIRFERNRFNKPVKVIVRLCRGQECKEVLKDAVLFKSLYKSFDTDMIRLCDNPLSMVVIVDFWGGMLKLLQPSSYASWKEDEYETDNIPVVTLKDKYGVMDIKRALIMGDVEFIGIEWCRRGHDKHIKITYDIIGDPIPILRLLQRIGLTWEEYPFTIFVDPIRESTNG